MTRPGSVNPSRRNGVAVNRSVGRFAKTRMISVHVRAGAWCASSTSRCVKPRKKTSRTSGSLACIAFGVATTTFAASTKALASASSANRPSSRPTLGRSAERSTMPSS